jgi:hypothetical protein
MAWEDEKFEAQRQAEMYQKELRFKQKLKAELVALKKRIASGSAEQKRQRQTDVERCVCARLCACMCGVARAPMLDACSPRDAPYRLLQRYQNVKTELEQQQSMERVRVEKFARIKAIGR